MAQGSPMKNELVSETEVEKALDFLRDGAAEIGAAKADAVRTEKMVKHIKALEMKRHSELPLGGQEREAYASDAYVQALMAEAVAAGEYERLRSLREAAAMRIGAWQTASANIRSIKL